MSGLLVQPGVLALGYYRPGNERSLGQSRAPSFLKIVYEFTHVPALLIILTFIFHGVLGCYYWFDYYTASRRR